MDVSQIDTENIEKYANEGAITSIEEMQDKAQCLLTLTGKQLRIQNIEGDEVIGTVWIYGSAGRNVCRSPVQGSHVILDIAHFRSGVYLVRFANKTTLFSERLVIIN